MIDSSIATNANISQNHVLQPDIHNEYISQDSYDSTMSAYHSYYYGRDYERNIFGRDRYNTDNAISETRALSAKRAEGTEHDRDHEREIEIDQNYDRERERDYGYGRSEYFSSFRRDKDREHMKYHYHRKQDHSRDSSRDRSCSRRRERHSGRRYERSREREHDRRHERDYRECEKSVERERLRLRDKDRDWDREYERECARDRERDRGRDRDRIRDRNRDWVHDRERELDRDWEHERAERCVGAASGHPRTAYLADYENTLSNHTVQPKIITAEKQPQSYAKNSSSTPIGNFSYPPYGYSVESHDSHSLWSQNCVWSQQPPLPPLPPLPPDNTDNWDRVAPPPIDNSYYRTENALPPIISEGTDKSDDANNGENSNLDLDTRIALMFKSKSLGNAPPFLQLDSSDSEPESSLTGKVDVSENDVNSVSNDLLSKLFNEQDDNQDSIAKMVVKEIQGETSDISSDDDEILKKEIVHQSTPAHKSGNKEEERISLSSLSSHDANELCSRGTQPIIAPLPVQPPLPPLPQTKCELPPLPTVPPSTMPNICANSTTSSFVYPSHIVGNPYYYSGGYAPFNAATPCLSNAASQYFTNSPYMQSSYLINMGNNLETLRTSAEAAIAYQNTCLDNARYHGGYSTMAGISVRDPNTLCIEEVIKRVSDELKQILKKDFNKKMVENTAFKSFESWWEEQLRESQNSTFGAEKVKDTSNRSFINPPESTHSLNSPKVNQFSYYRNDMLDFRSHFTSLGLRASIPKLPSFRRIPKRPSPISAKRNSAKDLSDQEEMVSGSDSEKDDSTISMEPAALTSTIPTVKRRGSGSSFSSSILSSDTDDYDEEGNVSFDDGGESGDDLSSISDDECKYKSEKDYPNKNQLLESENPEVMTPKKSVENNTNLKDLSDNAYTSDTQEETQENCLDIGKHSVKDEKSNNKLLSFVSDLEDISKDSTISFGNESESSSKHSTEDNLINKDKEITIPSNEQKDTTVVFTKAKNDQIFEYDRIYSDSDEEREYQERRRRNTEYMAQIEREFLEEQERQKSSNYSIKEQKNTETLLLTDLESAITLDTSSTSPAKTICLQEEKDPTTIQETLQVNEEKDSVASENDLLKVKTTIEHKIELSPPKESVENIIQMPPSPKNEIVKDLCSVETTLEDEIDKHQDQKKGTTGLSDGESSQRSQASQVSLDHCYSLPPEADKSGDNKKVDRTQQNKDDQKKKLSLAHDHGGYITHSSTKEISAILAESLQQSKTDTNILVAATTKPGPGRPKKDSNDRQGKVSRRYTRSKAVNRDVSAITEAYKQYTKALANFIPHEVFPIRKPNEEIMLLYEFLTKGIDAEDIKYIQKSYEIHLQEDTYG